MQDGPRAPIPDPDAAARPAADDGGELRYRQLFESSPLPLWVYDLQTLRFLDVNEVACAKYGWTRDEFLAMSILDIRPAEDARAVKDSVRDTPASVFSSGIWRHRLKNGEIILVEITSHEMTFMGRATRFVCPIDVTQRVRNEERLARHAEELEERVRQRTTELLVSNRELRRPPRRRRRRRSPRAASCRWSATSCARRSTRSWASGSCSRSIRRAR